MYKNVFRANMSCTHYTHVRTLMLGGNFLQANKKQLIKKCYNKKENEKGTGKVHGLKGWIFKEKNKKIKKVLKKCWQIERNMLIY